MYVCMYVCIILPQIKIKLQYKLMKRKFSKLQQYNIYRQKS